MTIARDDSTLRTVNRRTLVCDLNGTPSTGPQTQRPAMRRSPFEGALHSILEIECVAGNRYIHPHPHAPAAGRKLIGQRSSLVSHGVIQEGFQQIKV